MDEELNAYLAKVRSEHSERVYFFEQGLGAEVHWFFAQGSEALKAELYLPACTSFLIGIEASIRVTMAQIENPIQVTELDPYKILSNKLLLSAHKKGLPVKLLAFQGEDNFIEKITSTAKPSPYAEIVRIRHNLCHGNILEYVNTELGESNTFFTPECCRALALTLLNISKAWAFGLGDFRKKLNSKS
ncbi:hypothetical protein [Rosenbergiella epipactidis]|uniref:hypothetical protein n=1 Tax=Rosenbergiella epipactidis TaxID=1544694 RepID=UPI001F4D6A0B|nr:hypothetical protein [Rosenbergiella epipactidis]